MCTLLWSFYYFIMKSPNLRWWEIFVMIYLDLWYYVAFMLITILGRSDEYEEDHDTNTLD